MSAPTPAVQSTIFCGQPTISALPPTTAIISSSTTSSIWTIMEMTRMSSGIQVVYKYLAHSFLGLSCNLTKVLMGLLKRHYLLSALQFTVTIDHSVVFT